MEVISAEEEESQSVLFVANREVFSKTNFCFDFKRSPLPGFHIESVVLIGDLVLVLSPVYYQLISKQDSFMKGQNFGSIFVIHVFPQKLHGI